MIYFDALCCVREYARNSGPRRMGLHQDMEMVKKDARYAIFS
ncbi:Hypothetical protein Nlim_1845 [Candidatus Nitrosarchaeum limnium SFB1]|jgi:hypothetical protein|uniref:Uncharacterized protein n=1 Tax=Candidatus Nitrosarchaeum limnium SFB1 TaxID=886738 RepID=F3KMU0_9ARCH|nr:Hypothetical protein Nlim_1845 [Candidatus Nitrosarchaeum limnium SFB1]